MRSIPSSASIVGRLGLVLGGVAVCAFCGYADAQSGRGSMSGYVVFKNANEAAPRAHIELTGTNPQERLRYQADTNDRGLFEAPRVLAGEYRMRISAPGYKPYETTLYIPSDFLGNLAVVLKPARNKMDAK